MGIAAQSGTETEMTETTFADEWAKWHQQRQAGVSGPYAMLALVGTHWVDGATSVPEVPGVWSVESGVVTVRSESAAGLVVDGVIVDGVARPRSDRDPDPSTISHGDWKLALIEREGQFAVRVYDPHARTRTSFVGIEAYAPDEAWVLPATFVGYPDDSAERVERVANADGRDRGLALSGEVRFDHGGQTYTLRVGNRRGGGLEAVFADRTSGRDGHDFRFVHLPAPDEDGRTLLDFNRAHLPPCAFADHYLCPSPPAGNTLPFAVTAGERAVRRRD
ncbi:DUF1684 domain-containing protein [Actinopolymorpha singaporensis]|uniref:DUF1684 domain-containing protein n=1 Tax=Actinopolymorpha singaporensis TaxID=117157 RepID=A0A1H1WZ76_9ACTN|nr:DUF1684 domain-containing protein [Actinopolymorpha singaporensis]SDT01716.1 hypothetical protein SAMN04489717_4714 [Actinopolymorpha singaporensis]